MKKFIITVPDEIIRVGSGKTPHTRMVLPVTESLIAEALTLNEYHDNLYFEGAVKVKQIED